MYSSRCPSSLASNPIFAVGNSRLRRVEASRGGPANAGPGYDSCMARPAARAPKPSAPLERAVRSETVKHYAETIFYIRQEEGRVRPGRLAEWLGVSAPTVTVTLQRLARDGFLEIGSDRSVTLTPAGEDLAAKIVRVHRLLERWLTDVLGLDWAAADEEAQRLASGVSEVVADRLDETL